MTLHYQDDTVTLHHGDALVVLRTLPDNSIDAVVTDPPYELTAGKKGGTGEASLNVNSPAGRSRIGTGGFMGHQWDATGIAHSVEFWSECLRVLKPGSHVLAFGGTRTWHRLACAVEDAGFEIRDTIAWLYGSGFSKSWNFKTMFNGEWCSCPTANALPYSHAGNPDLLGLRDDVHKAAIPRSTSQDAGLLAPMQRRTAGPGVGDSRPQGPRRVVGGDGSQGGRVDARREEPSMAGRFIHRAGEGLSDDPTPGSPEGAGEWLRSGTPTSDGTSDWSADSSAGGGAPHQRRQGGQPAGESASVPGSHESLDDRALRGRPSCPHCGGLNPTYRGFGTGLKPAFEPVVCARKPLRGTVAANVLAYGTGALHIAASRVATDDDRSRPPRTPNHILGGGRGTNLTASPSNPAGRWPANVVLDEHAAAALDEQSGTLTSGALDRSKIVAANAIYGTRPAILSGTYERDSGGASRYFKVIERDAEWAPLGENSTTAASTSADFPSFKYQAKAPSSERPNVDGITHSTVKPVDLMRWLVRLVTPKGGTVLEPFAGSGTTVEACILEHFHCIAIEREGTYLPLIGERITRARAELDAIPPSLFDIPEPRAASVEVPCQMDLFGEIA